MESITGRQFVDREAEYLQERTVVGRRAELQERTVIGSGAERPQPRIMGRPIQGRIMGRPILAVQRRQNASYHSNELIRFLLRGGRRR